MSYYVLIDSCGELTEEMKAEGCFQNIPLTIEIEGHHIIDDETFDQKDFLKRVAMSEKGPKSSCPSPDSYLKAFEKDADHIYAVTLSAELSGSYNSAQLGRSLALEKDPDKQIHVFNSKSASIGETLIGLKIKECEEKHMSFSDTVKHVEDYIDSQVTWFVLETLETLRKNGRLSNLKARVASVLNIKPVMSSTPSGSITQIAQARGINRALVRMVESIEHTVHNAHEKILAISHCNCPDRAKIVRDALVERIHPKDVIVLDTNGISSMYASDGGIIVVI